jgi:predicted NUDIX family NTP pyrophosphohydrolase
MTIISCGVLLYRTVNGLPEFLLTKSGHPAWKERDFYSWGIPKGRKEIGESDFQTASREFKEETGIELPAINYVKLGKFVQPSGKQIVVYAGKVDEFPIENFSSISSSGEHPAGSGITIAYPEIEKIDWFPMDNVKQYVFFGQKEIINTLLSKLSE